MPRSEWIISPCGGRLARTARESAAAAAQRQTILLSVDGLAPRVLADAMTPTLDRLAREGTTALAEAVIPSVTLPNHASMLTGLEPERHGVDWNRYQPWRRVEAETIFSRCREEALRCGLFAGKVKFVHFAEDETGVERYAYAESAGEVLALAATYLVERQPHFVMIHLADVDLAGHDAGWGSSEQLRVIEQVDAALGLFLERAAALQLRLLVTADHGGHGTRHGTDLPDDVRIPWFVWGEGISAGRIEERVSTLDTAPTLLRLLELPLPSGWRGRARLP